MKKMMLPSSQTSGSAKSVQAWPERVRWGGCNAPTPETMACCAPVHAGVAVMVSKADGSALFPFGF